MPVYMLDNEHWFPPVNDAEPDGLLAVGGDLDTDRLLLAYKGGIFPWYNEEDPPLWWSPDPRFVLLPGELKVSKSMAKIIRDGVFEFRVNSNFGAVIQNCKNVPRPGQGGTWINDDILSAYTALHKAGYVYSAEAWQNGHLVGGLYGMKMGKVFFGESMFSHVSNASKFAFISWVRMLQGQGVELIDCQVYTTHLESLGAKMIPRAQFLDLLATLIK